MAEPTKLPWKLGRRFGDVISDESCKDALRGSDDVKYYGGHLVCESVAPSRARLIVTAVNHHQQLVHALRDLTEEASSIRERLFLALGCLGNPPSTVQANVAKISASLHIADALLAEIDKESL